MLEQFGLTEKIHAVNTDNATLNDTQTTKLDQLDNTFDEENYKKATLFFSQDSASIVAVIPAMNKLDTDLNP